MSDKQATDQAKRASNIEVSDLVLLSTRYLSLRSSPGKLKPCFIRPFRVTKAVGANAFELEFSATMKVHPVFNVSLLCKFQGEYKPPGLIIVDGEAEYEVEKIFRRKGNGKRRQYLVRYLGYDESEDC